MYHQKSSLVMCGNFEILKLEYVILLKAKDQVKSNVAIFFSSFLMLKEHQGPIKKGTSGGTSRLLRLGI